MDHSNMASKSETESSDQAIVRVRIDHNLRTSRPIELISLWGDSRKAAEALSWKASTAFGALVAEMVAADLALLRKAYFGEPGLKGSGSKL